MVKNGVSIGHGSQIQAFGVLFWCLFCTFLLQSAIIEKVCFAYIKHTILLNLRAWVQTFFRSFFEPATLLATFSSRLTFGMIFDHFDSPMAPFWPPVARQILVPPCPSGTYKWTCVPKKGPRCPNWPPRALRRLQMWPKWYQKWNKTKCKARALSDWQLTIVAARAELVDMILGLVLQLNLKQNWTFLHVKAPWYISPVWGAFL